MTMYKWSIKSTEYFVKKIETSKLTEKMNMDHIM